MAIWSATKAARWSQTTELVKANQTLTSTLESQKAQLLTLQTQTEATIRTLTYTKTRQVEQGNAIGIQGPRVVTQVVFHTRVMS